MDDFALAVEYSPNNLEYLLDYVDALYLNQQLDKAIIVAKRILRIEPYHRTTYSKLLLFYKDKDNNKEMIKLLKKYLSFAKDDEFQTLLKELNKK